MKWFKTFLIEVVLTALVLGYLVNTYPDAIRPYIPWFIFFITAHTTWNILQSRPLKRRIIRFGLVRNKSMAWLITSWIVIFCCGGLLACLYWYGINKSLSRLQNVQKTANTKPSVPNPEASIPEDAENALSVALSSQPYFHPRNDKTEVYGVKWNDTYVFTVIYIGNKKAFDLRNVDIYLETDQTFAKIKQLTLLQATLQPSCVLPNSMTSNWTRSSGDAHQADLLPGEDVDTSGLYITNGYHIHLERFPAGDKLTLLLAAMAVDTNRGAHLGYDKNGGIVGSRTEIKFARISGTYEAEDPKPYTFDTSDGVRPAMLQISSVRFPDVSLQSNPAVLIAKTSCPAK